MNNCSAWLYLIPAKSSCVLPLLNGLKKKVLLVCSPYYQNITNNLIEGAIKVLKSYSVEYKILNVPGALEIAPAIKLVIDKSIKFEFFPYSSYCS